MTRQNPCPFSRRRADQEREKRIRSMLAELLAEPDTTKRREISMQYVSEINRRSPEQIARMEKEIGLPQQ